MAMVDEKWGRNQQVAAYDRFAILRPSGLPHIPPNLVVGRCWRTLIASRSEDLQVEHPVRGRDATTLHFHPTLARVQGPALIRDQVVQVRQAGEKRCLTPTGMVEAFHG